MKKINIPIYNKSFFITTDEVEFNLFHLKYNGEMLDISTCDGVCADIGYGYYLIGIFRKEISVLTHELTHLAIRCLNNGDNYDLRHNDEQLAYLIQYLTKVSLKALSINNKF